MNDSIKAMLAKPGRYAVSDAANLLIGRYIGIEVDENLVAYQLTQDGKRDGVLAPDGWDDFATCIGDLEEVDAILRPSR